MAVTNSMIANKSTVLNWTGATCSSRPTDRGKADGETFVIVVDEPLRADPERVIHRRLDSAPKTLIGTDAKCPLKPSNSCVAKPGPRTMLSHKRSVNGPQLEVSSISDVPKPSRNSSRQSCTPGKSGIIARNPSIKEKISEWEGKKEVVLPADKEKPVNKEAKELDGKSGPVNLVEGMTMKKGEGKAGNVWTLESKDAGKENEYKVSERTARSLEAERRLLEDKESERAKPDSAMHQVCEKAKGAGCARLTPPPGTAQERTTVLGHIKKLEEKAKDDLSVTHLQLPGDYYTTQRLHNPALASQPSSPAKDKKDGSCSSELKRKHIQSNSDSEASETIFGAVDKLKSSWASCKIRNVEDLYSEPGPLDQQLAVNPVPKPRRTFEYGTEKPSGLCVLRRSTRQLPALPVIPPPLPLSPPPTGSAAPTSSRPRLNSRDNRRKSFEFEDVKDLQRLQSPDMSRGGQADWYAQSKLALNCAVSEENIYEDILDVPKENHYEDIESADRHSLGKQCPAPHPSSGCSTPKPGSPSETRPDTPTKLLMKAPSLFRHSSERRSFKLLDIRKISKDGVSSPSKASPPSTPSSPDDTLSLAGDSQQVKRRKKIPKVVLKINAIYDARRGRKKLRRITPSSEAGTGRVTDENSETDSETEEKLKAHSQRLVLVKSLLRQKSRYRTLERDLIEFQEWQLFEFFVVVALHMKKGSSGGYLPEVTQQFPLKLDKPFKFMRETEDQLKVIPQFCFPDARDWVPVSEFPSETFSFVLTGEDGSRRFGYCRRLLPTGKGKRLPEVYCIVSRLGCFNLFSKILDEVEKRRVISPALVQPFMRSIMEAPFPAPGRTITVRNFLPGSGNEVIQLCRPLDSRLEHVDFECLFSSLTIRQLIKVFASLLLERRVIFTADKLSTLSKCCHAVMALLYPFAWQHTYIPVLPPSMIDIACSPTPFLIGLLSSSLPKLKELPLEEVLVVNLGTNKFLRQVDDEDSILPRKLQMALEQVLEMRNDLVTQDEDSPLEGVVSLNTVVSETFVRFFVEIAGHYSLHMASSEKDERIFLGETFRKSIASKSIRRFLEVFMETQMFGGFIQDRELRKLGVKGLFELRAQDYLEALTGGEQRGMNRFLRGLGSKMKFLHKK